jgi:hypothetical protein
MLVNKFLSVDASSFSILSGALSPKKAISNLLGRDYGIVLNRSESPITLVTVKDLERITDTGSKSLLQGARKLNFPRTVVAGHRIDMDLLSRSHAVISLEKGAHGVVIVRGANIAGVLPADIIERYRRSRNLTRDTVTASLYMPGAGIGQPLDASQLPQGIIKGSRKKDETDFIPIICAEDGCGYANLLEDWFLPGEQMPPCQNPKQPPPPHLLKLASNP